MSNIHLLATAANEVHRLTVENERLRALLLQVVEQRWRLPSIRASLRDEICEELGCGQDPHKWDENILRKRNVPKGRENAG